VCETIPNTSNNRVDIANDGDNADDDDDDDDV